MAGNWRRTGGAAANGFGPRTLLRAESEALWENGYPVPPDMRVGGRFGISASGIPVPRLLTRAKRDFYAAQNTHYWNDLTPEQREDPRWNQEDPGNVPRYEEVFQRVFGEEMNRWDGPGPVPRDKNVLGREAFWSVPRRTLPAIMEHIANGGSMLEWPPAAHAPPPPPPQAPPANRWAARASPPSSRSTASSSRASSSSRSSSSRSRATALITPKPEPMKVKAEPGTSQAAQTLYAELLAAQQAHDDDDLLRAAEAASLNDVPPMDGPAACAWSAYMHAQETGVPFVDLTGDAPALAA